MIAARRIRIGCAFSIPSELTDWNTEYILGVLVKFNLNLKDPLMSIQARSAASIPVLTRLPEPLLPYQWASYQTGLSNAEHRTLRVLVDVYGGFQARNQSFYIVESLVSDRLHIAFETFRNYITKLHNLGLLTLKYRSPNQHGGRSLWAMNLDVVLTNGQLPLTLPDASETDDALTPGGDVSADAPEVGPGPVQELAASVDEQPNEQLEFVADHTESEPAFLDVSALSDTEIAAIVEAKRDDPEWKGLFSMTVEELAVKMDDVKGLGNRIAVATRYADSQENGQVKHKAPRKTPPHEPVVTIQSDLLITFKGVVEALGVPRLSEAEIARVVEMEARWTRNHPGERTPTKFVQYAADEAARSSRRDSVKYMLKVLEDSLERGFTSRRFPQSGSGQWGSRYGIRKNRY